MAEVYRCDVVEGVLPQATERSQYYGFEQFSSVLDGVNAFDPDAGR